MTDDEWLDVLILLEGGATLLVPIQTPLFPETEAIRSILTSTGRDTYALTTYFREHAPGHGWSNEQSETQHLDADDLAQRLRHHARDSVRAHDRARGLTTPSC